MMTLPGGRRASLMFQRRSSRQSYAGVAMPMGGARKVSMALTTNCPVCGGSVTPGVNPCPHCGATLDWAA